jgi:hypothetical protein
VIENENEAPAAWDSELDDNPWSCHARRATVMLESGAHAAHAVLVDDRGTRRYVRIENDRIPSFFAAVSRAWSSADRSESLAVIWVNRPLTVKGGWPPPPPPPPPLTDDVLQAVTLGAHHEMLAAIELVIRRA